MGLVHASGSGGGDDAEKALEGDAGVSADTARREAYDPVVDKMQTEALLQSDADLRLMVLNVCCVFHTKRLLSHPILGAQSVSVRGEEVCRLP